MSGANLSLSLEVRRSHSLSAGRASPGDGTYLSIRHHIWRPSRGTTIAAFFDELKLFGFVEGKNLDVVPGGFNLREDQYAEYART